MSNQWSYFTLRVGIPYLAKADGWLNQLGAEGWELVSASTMVKSVVNLTGNDVLYVLKKPGAGQRPSVDLNNVLEYGVEGVDY